MARNKKKSSYSNADKEWYPVHPRNYSQRLLMESIQDNKITIAIGSAGTAKTLISLYEACKLYRHGAIDKIYYLRNDVGMKGLGSIPRGALPGDEFEKARHLLHPIMDNIGYVMNYNKAKFMIENKIIEPIIFDDIRGRSLRNSFVLLDECLPGDTMVETNLGRRKLLSIIKNPDKYEVLSLNEATREFEYKPVVNTFYQGKKPLSKVVFTNKRAKKATRNHKFLTDKGWKRLDELKKGEPVISHNGKVALLNSQQKSVVVGSILGDGSLQEVSKYCYRLKLVQGEKQLDYLKNKLSVFRTDLRLRTSRKGYQANTKNFYLDLPNREDRFEWAIDNLDDLALAIAWGDDGSVNKGQLHSVCFSKDLATKLSTKINQMYGIDSYVRETRRGYFPVVFRKPCLHTLLEKLSKYCQPSVEYKYLPNSPTLRFEAPKPVTCSIVDYLVIDYKMEDVYDIEVEDNHNFLVNDCRKAKETTVVHNCQNVPPVGVMTALTRLDRTCKIVLSGDPHQKDSTSKYKDGLSHAARILSDLDFVGAVYFTDDDIERDPDNTEIIQRYRDNES